MAEAWKEIRVFISSTFRDMQAERDHLVRFVFPRVREKLLQRQLRLVDVDLRWGVTADQDAFDLCMMEIELCRPRFLCMLGGRFGWVPPPKKIETAFLGSVIGGTSKAGAITDEERESVQRLYTPDGNVANLREKPKSTADVDRYNLDGNVAVSVFQRAGHPETRSSITAAEIFHGALDELDRPLFRFFYFRDPAATAAIPEPYASDYREPPGSFAERRLDELKGVITDPDTKGMVPVEPGVEKRRPLPAFIYPAKWDDRTRRLINLQEFGERVERDLLESIDAEFGEAKPLEGFAAETAAMEAFMETRVQRYVVGSRAKAFEELNELATGGDKPATIVLVGEPGSGKSAMLSKFTRDYRAKHRDHLVVTHFVGASPASTNVRQLLRRLWHELIQGAGLAGGELDAIPDDWDKLRAAIPDVLRRAGEARHVVLVIDAVNQLDSAHQAHAMRWLPEELPANVRAILSVLPGPAYDALHSRATKPRFSPIARLTSEDASAIMDGYLERYGKTLAENQRSTLLAKKDAGNALYLLTALEELRTLGTYEEISQRIDDLPEETVPLFVWIMRRLEGDPGFRGPQAELIGSGIVRKYCSYLAASRFGMSETELRELAADESGNVAALTRLLRPYLMHSGELLKFFHGQIEQAARTTYLHDEADRIAAHRDIALYFKHKGDPSDDQSWSNAADYPRSVSELPHHTTEAHMWEDLYSILTDLAFLEAKCTYVDVQEVQEGAQRRKVYAGVYDLQDDYRRALEVFPTQLV